MVVSLLMSIGLSSRFGVAVRRLSSELLRLLVRMIAPDRRRVLWARLSASKVIMKMIMEILRKAGMENTSPTAPVRKMAREGVSFFCSVLP
jgi:hypothetical protein